MKLIKPYTFELSSVPFSDRDDQVVYVESKHNEKVNRFIEEHLEELQRLFRSELLEFVYVKRVCDSVEGDVDPSCICRGSRTAYHLDISPELGMVLMMDQFRDIARAYSRRDAMDYKGIARDEETARMLIEMERLARALKVKGVKSQVFDDMLTSLERPSHLRMDRYGHITLPDFGNMQIRLNPIQKTLYAFFLNHPEGIVADELVGHWKELVHLYKNASVFGEWERAEDALEALCSEDKQTFYTNKSRINSIFKRSLGEKIGEHYCIQKDQDGVFKVTLSPDLVMCDPCWKCRM